MAGNLKDLVREWFDRVWNQNDASAIAELMPTDGQAKGLTPDEITTAAQFEAFHEEMNKVFSDIRIEDLKMVEEGNHVSGIFTVKADHPRAKDRVVFQSSFFVTVEDGKFVRSENLVDFASVLDQIGEMSQAEFRAKLA